MEIIFFLLIGWSITSILVNGSIFDPLRNYLTVKAPFFSKLLTCMQCSGFWVGVILGSLAVTKTIVHPLESLVKLQQEWISLLIYVLAYAFTISGISVIINSILVFLLSKNNSDEQH
jgi:hypothetical protein